MRKIIEWCYVSADGVFEDPIRMGLTDYLDDDAYVRDALGLFEACDALLWGRSPTRYLRRSMVKGEGPLHMPHGSTRSQSTYFRRGWREPSGTTQQSFAVTSWRR
jgi:hypothetical protein